jgi:transaldolase
MNPTRTIHQPGQSLWLDNVTRGLLTGGTLQRDRDELSVTGLTSNPTIFASAIEHAADYHEAIKTKLADGKQGEELAGRGPE